MSLMFFILIVSLLLILFNNGETKQCPSSYNPIATGCYKVNNGSNRTWSDAQQDCNNDLKTLPSNEIEANATTHLVALEIVMEKTALFYWLTAYQFTDTFWTDGIFSTSSWNWSNQSITWYFNATERDIIGNGTNYKIAYSLNDTTYQIADDVNNHLLHYLCEYQVRCNASNACQNNATCYMNLGYELCLCAPGFTGQYCDTIIDECLSSPCLHGGICINGIDNYTCDCSDSFFTGSNCEILTPDPTQSKRTAAFWAVFGVVTGLVLLLTLSDLPLEDIFTAIGCSCSCLKCCFKRNHAEDINEKNLRLSDSPTNDNNLGTRKISMYDGTLASKGMNYHVMNTVWDPEYINNQTPTNPQYNGYRSPDQAITPDNAHILSFANVAMAKQKQKELDDKRVYAVNINEPTKTKDPVDTMVNWTQQLQEQLKNKKSRQTSASSTEQLIHSSNKNDY